MTAAGQPLVSIGIPTYNRPAGLRRTLEAITTQGYRNLEIVVSDNCSPDPMVRETVLEFSARDPRITYHRQEANIGAVKNFFALTALAKGDYFMWAADDDWWDRDFVEVSVGLLEANPAACVAMTRFEPLPAPSGKPQRLPRSFEKIREFSHPDLCERLGRYIRQKESYGKAHIAYGLFRTRSIQRVVETVMRVVTPTVPIQDFQQVDCLMNGVLLSLGNIVTSDRCLRKFSSGPRKGTPNPPTSLAQRLIDYDPRFLGYLDFYFPVIEGLELPEPEKEKLRAAVRRRKSDYVWERIGRRLGVYRLYWHFHKKSNFQSYP